MEEGDTLQLQCEVLAGSPMPSLRLVMMVKTTRKIEKLFSYIPSLQSTINTCVCRWRQCGGSVVSEQEELSLQEVGRHQAGCYTCEADNGFSITPVTKEVTIIVQCEF